MATQSQAQVSGMFDEATRSFGDALKAGVKVQEDIAKWWTDAFNQAAPVQEWQKRSRAMVSEAIPAAQKNAEEWIKLLEQNYKRSLELVKLAFENDQPASAREAQARTQELWEASVSAVRDSAQAMSQANLKMMSTWSDILKKNLDGRKSDGKHG